MPINYSTVLRKSVAFLNAGGCIGIAGYCLSLIPPRINEMLY